MSTLDRCPGNELNKSLTVYNFVCKKCGKENEIFADETGKTNKCSACGEILDTSNTAD